MIKFTSQLIILLSCLFWAPLSQAQEEAQSSPVNQMTSVAVQLGVLTCAARVQQISTFLGYSNQTNAIVRKPLGVVDQSSFSLAMTVETDGEEALAVAEFYPSVNGCKATYTITVNLRQSCEEVRSTRFTDLTDSSSLSNAIEALVGENTMRIFLVDAGTGCTLIKTETID